MAFNPPDNLLEVLQKIQFEQPLAVDDPRYVETTEARGSQKTLGRLARKSGCDLNKGGFSAPPSKHVLFFGHVGVGKTTELRHCARALEGASRFLVIEVDSVLLLDPNNVQYADALMAQAQMLIERLPKMPSIHVDNAVLQPLEDWFAKTIREQVKGTELAAAIEAGATAESKLPFIGGLFAKFTASVKSNVTYKETLRREVRNSFTQLAAAFNALVLQVENALQTAGVAQRVLFIIDGTDKMRGEDVQRFFIEDAEQLLQVNTLVVYTAPIALKYSGMLTGKLDTDLMLPMIKLAQPDGKPFETGRKAMRDILLKRAARALFADDAVIDRLIEFSGGHPRELLRLLRLCCELSETDVIDNNVVTDAIRQVASEYRYQVLTSDYPVLVEVDRDPAIARNDEITQRLLLNLALMQYNDGSWRRSQPVVRTLDGYRRASSSAAVAPTGAPPP